MEPGERFGDYEILEIAGQGGMGIVYRARQLTLERIVALKVIAPDVADAPDFKTRFQRESRLAASIDHPHVVSIYSAGELEGRAYIAMQWVDGTNLDQLVGAGRPLAEPRVRTITTQLAEALAAAHSTGLVHRDIKPPNVLVRSIAGADHSYLTDFGIARRVDIGATGLTKTGQTVGTVGYMAPEQIRGDRSDGRADLYSLGCVLYQCLTGHRPFERDSEVAVMFAHVNDPRPMPSSLRPELAAYDGLMTKALALDPGDRFQTGVEFATALRAVGSGLGAGAETTVAGAFPPPLRSPGDETRPGPTAELPEGSPAPPPPSSQPERAPGTGKKIAIGLGAVLVLAAIAFGGLRATGLFEGGESGRAVDDKNTTTTADSGDGDGGGGGSGGAGGSGATTKADAAEIESTLENYAAAFTNKDIGAMKELLTDDVSRRGLGAGGCTTTNGIDDVLATYKQQFALNPGAYDITDTSASGSNIDGNSASIDTGYTLGSGASGTISFDLSRSGSSWLISNIVASC
ncbi:MAG: protein kinase domain-containing protein [Solirubrobacterales bacterium]